VIIAISNDCWALQYASDELKNDKEVVLAAVSNIGWTLQYASEELKNDKEVVLAAVSNEGWTLKFASDDLKNNKEIVLTAVRKCGSALKFASFELQNNYNNMKELFMLAIKTFYSNHEDKLYNEKTIYDCILSKELKNELNFIKQIYNYYNYKQVCDHINETGEIKKYSYRIPLIDTKFRFI